jgi:uncharacterized protein YegP (UPF0339 family)
LRAKNGIQIGKSGLYNLKASSENGIAAVAKNAPDAKIADTLAE